MWHIVSPHSTQVVVGTDEIHGLEEGGFYAAGKGGNIGTQRTPWRLIGWRTGLEHFDVSR